MMKKTLLFAAAFLMLAACSKESPMKEDTIDTSKIVFNISVENADARATKGIKTAWEDGDVVYAFFQGNTTQYVKMTYNGTSWVYTDKDGNDIFDGLNLAASGQKVSAVYFPDFVCSTDPTYNVDKWTFGSVSGYYQTAVADYTVTTTSDVFSLNATINLSAPSNIVQAYIPSTEYTAPNEGEEYVLTATHIIPFIFIGIVPGEKATHGTTTNGFPLTAYAGTIGGDTGYYFWGILESPGNYSFDFQLVKQSAEKKYAISSKSKTTSSLLIPGNVAFKISGFTDNGKFVSLGYEDGPLWATGNLDATNKTIVGPLEAGEHFMYGFITPYSYPRPPYYTGEENPLSTDRDAAYQANNAWRIPTIQQFTSLINPSNTDSALREGWTALGEKKAGYLITSKVNGISLFFPAAGCYFSGASPVLVGERGYYWSSSSSTSASAQAHHLNFYDESIYTNMNERAYGFSIRPVKN